ncbi:MAG: hypothetical protein HZA02_03160 [Nitrospinae bacterium]|nr:hypothetical protein [Nitrospinota bacterium]
MTDYARIGDAVRTTLLADSWLGNPANVKTVETHKRGFSLQDDKDALAFSHDELPAIAIVPNAGPKQSDQTATNEIRSVARSQAAVVSYHRDARTGLNNHLQIVANLERVLERQKTSQDDLGIDAFVAEVSTEQEQFKKGEYYYFLSRTDFNVEVTSAF